MNTLMQVLAKIRPYFNRMLVARYPDGWHSFDRTPWMHPWLTQENLARMREFSIRIRNEAAVVASTVDWHSMSFAFVGNMANSSYQRISALKQIGVDASLYLHPGDTFPMSQPEWEEYGGVLPKGAATIDEIRHSGMRLPDVKNVFRLAPINDWGLSGNTPHYMRYADYMRWPHYFNYLPILQALQTVSAAYTVQSPYLAYLARRPYIATHMGGDIWYECSRGDELGAIQRKAFRSATALTISNPWSPAFARRYGLRNMVILPMILNTDTYCPGNGQWREGWQAQVGGEFFVLTTARIDDRYKGSNLALEGFARFAAKAPGARLVLLGWGNDLASSSEHMRALGISERVIVLPPSGKKRLIEYLRSADCLLDQFVLGYFGLTALEAMAVGLPVIMRLEDAQYGAFLDTGAPPVLNASDSSEVAEKLSQLATMPEFRKAISDQGIEWFVRSASPQAWGRSYRDLLIAAAIGHKFDFRDSPLAEPLSRDEIEYHRQEHESAPRFPNYN